MGEAATHGASSMDAIYSHESGAVYSFVDTVGTLLALYCLNVTSVSCSQLPIGEGNDWTAHGCFPVPATLRLLVEMPTCPSPMGAVTGELVIPTGAALYYVMVNSRHTHSAFKNQVKMTARHLGGHHTAGEDLVVDMVKGDLFEQN